MGRARWIAGALVALALVPAAGAAVTRADAEGTTLLDGKKVFPIILAKGPEPGAKTPSGADALDEVVSAGVTFLKVGPATVRWTQADIDDALANDRAAAARGIHTWVNLATVSRATPGSTDDTVLHDVVGTLKADASGSAIGMWKGADEPWWSKIPVSSLEFAYCLATSRGAAGWCAGESPVDADHLWVTIQAPKGTTADLAPYSAVTDVHGVDHYPVTLTNADPDLHGVGNWTATVADATPSKAVWTTLQVCASGSYNASTGQFVLPTRQQERYVIYDAILNGARNLAFYGGNIPGCWSASDAASGWNWTFWDGVLKPLVQEINAGSPIAPALVNPGSTQALSSSDPSTQVVMRQGVDANDLWIIAAKSGVGAQAVTIGGLPSGATTAAVYTEGRSVEVSNGALTDTFGRWDVHVYHLTLVSPPPTPPPSGGGGGGGGGDSASAPTPVVTPTPPPPPSPPPAPTPAPPPPFRLVAAGLSTTPLSAVAGRRLTARLQVLTDTGARVGKGRVACAATVGKLRLRVSATGWTRIGAACTWRLPRSAAGKLLRATIRVSRNGSTAARSLTRRVGSPQ